MSSSEKSPGFSPFAISVASRWDEFRRANPNSLSANYTQKHRVSTWAKFESPRRYHYAIGLISSALVLKLFGDDNCEASRLLSKAEELAAQVDAPGALSAPGSMARDEGYRAYVHSGYRLEARLYQAIATGVAGAQAPDAGVLTSGVGQLIEMFENWPTYRPDGTKDVMRGVMAALLARRLDLAERLLAVRKTQPQYKKSFSLFKKIVKMAKAVDSDDERYYRVDDLSMHTALFELFNPLRAPSLAARSSTGVEQGSYVGDSIVESYLYAWLYLLYFADPPRSRTDWGTLREIMVG